MSHRLPDIALHSIDQIAFDRVSVSNESFSETSVNVAIKSYIA